MSKGPGEIERRVAGLFAATRDRASLTPKSPATPSPSTDAQLPAPSACRPPAPHRVIRRILGAIIGRQAAQLSENLPTYQVEISKKLDAVRSSAFGARMVEKAADALHGLEHWPPYADYQVKTEREIPVVVLDLH
jgi:hypothetical protein